MKRVLSIVIAACFVAILAGCDFWPRELKPLAEEISAQVSGEATAWRLGGDIVVIEIAGSPLYGEPADALESVANDIATQAAQSSAVSLESVVVTFHEDEVTDDPDRMREFIFLMTNAGPERAPSVNLEARGPLTADEIQTAVERLAETMDADERACVRRELTRLAGEAGDPETLDPATVRFLTHETWSPLDAFGKRLILTQALSTQAAFACVQGAATQLGDQPG